MAMFISGWYIFSLKDRQVELIKAKEWVDAHESIIISAKENQERLNALQDTIANAQAEKNNLFVIVNDAKESLSRAQSEYNRFNKEVELNKSDLIVLQKKIAAANVNMSSLRGEIPDLEQKVENLNATKIDLESKVGDKNAELNKLEGKITGVEEQLEELTSGLKKIQLVDSDFSQVKLQLS